MPDQYNVELIDTVADGEERIVVCCANKPVTVSRSQSLPVLRKEKERKGFARGTQEEKRVNLHTSKIFFDYISREGLDPPSRLNECKLANRIGQVRQLDTRLQARAIEGL